MRHLLVTGASGQVGGHVLRLLRGMDLDVSAWSGSRQGELFGFALKPVDLTDPDTTRHAFSQEKPDVVLHAAALARVGDCYRDPDLAQRVNVEATALLVELCQARGARLVLTSTDMVFDGERAPYREDSPTEPLSVYGRTKLEAEHVALSRTGNIVARLSVLIGPGLCGRPSFFDEQVKTLGAGRPITLFADEWRSPLDLPSAALALIALARSNETGIFHVGGPERLSRFEMGRVLARVLGVPAELVQPATRLEASGAEPRPRDTSMNCSRWRATFPALPWPDHQTALRAMLTPSA